MNLVNENAKSNFPRLSEVLVPNGFSSEVPVASTMTTQTSNPTHSSHKRLRSSRTISFLFAIHIFYEIFFSFLLVIALLTQQAQAKAKAKHEKK
jgi:hypothetical protein